MRFEIAYLKGFPETERGWVDSIQIDMRVLRGRLVALSSCAVKAEV